MRKIIKGFESMPPREIIDCRITGLRDMLLYHGIDIDSHTMFILGCGLDYVFEQRKMRESSKMYLWMAQGSPMMIVDNVLEGLGISINECNAGSGEEGWLILKDYIDRDIPVMVILDSNYIHEDKVVKKADQLYIGGVSSSPLAGYDTERKSVFMDFRGDDSSELRELSLEDFMAARDAKCFPYSPQNRCYLLDIKEEQRKGIWQDMDRMVLRSLNKTCGYMLGEDNPDRGIKGMRTTARVIREFAGAFEEDLPEELAAKLFILKIKCLRQIMLPGSNTFFRDEFGKGLKSSARLLNSPSLTKIGDSFIDCGKKWRNLLRLMASVDYRLKDKRKYYIEVSKAFDEMADYEEKHFLRLREALGKLTD